MRVCICTHARTIGCLELRLWKSAKYNKIKSAPLLYIHRMWWSEVAESFLTENELEGIRMALA